MSYELNRLAEQNRRALRTTLQWLFGLLFLVFVAMLGFGIALLKQSGHREPEPQPIAIYAMGHASAEAGNHWRVLCFRRSPEYASGQSGRCSKDAAECGSGYWTTQAGADGTRGENLQDFLDTDPAPHIELALMVGGHDEARVRPNRKFASNADLALQRAAHAASTTLPDLLLKRTSVIGKVASDDTTSLCRNDTTEVTPEQLRTPVLILVVDDSANRREPAP